MSNSAFTNKFARRMFRRIGGVVWDLTTGKNGLETDDGVYTLAFKEDGTPYSNLNLFSELSVGIPSFAVITPLTEIQVGDVIVGATTILGWAVEAPGTGASIKVLDPKDGHGKTITPPKVSAMNQDGILVVKNLFSLTGGADGAAGLANNMLPLIMMMGDGGDDKLEKLFPLMLMQSAGGTGAAAGGMNPMMLLALSGGLGGGNSKIDPMMLMAMSGGLGGGAGGMNPMMMAMLMKDGLGGSDKPARVTAPIRSYGIPTVPPIIDETPL